MFSVIIKKKCDDFEEFLKNICIFQIFVVLLCAESTNKLYIRLISGYFKYDIIESEDSVHTAMVGADLRHERTTIAASFVDVLC